jgi:hypothetical protein
MSQPRRARRTQSFPSDSIFSTLTPKEKASVLSPFPSYANPPHFLYQGLISCQDQRHHNGLVAVSSHYVGVFSQSNSGYPYAKIAFFHILTLRSLAVDSPTNVSVSTSTGFIFSVFENPIDLARILYRNHAFATFSIPDALKAKISAFNDEIFPVIHIPLSYSQILQFRFAALCAQNEFRYEHSVIPYLQSLLSFSSAIVDLARIPAPYHRPFLSSFLHFLPIFGISATELNIPSLVADIANYTEKSKDLRYLKIDNCNCGTNLRELSRAFKSNSENLPLSFLSITNVQLGDVDAFLNSISFLKTHLIHFSLSSAGIHPRNAVLLTNLLNDCPVFDRLQYLGIGAIEFNDSSLSRFALFLAKCRTLRFLDLSGSDAFTAVLAIAVGSSVTGVSLASADFDDSAVLQLLELAPRLSSLDLSGSNLKSHEIGDILAVLGRDLSGVPMSVQLNDFDFSQARCQNGGG